MTRSRGAKHGNLSPGARRRQRTLKKAVSVAPTPYTCPYVSREWDCNSGLTAEDNFLGLLLQNLKAPIGSPPTEQSSAWVLQVQPASELQISGFSQ